jgi:hypothetical protein
MENFSITTALGATGSNGYVPGVSIITTGEALGHNVEIDGTTLEQVAALGNGMGRVKVGVDHDTGMSGVIGWTKSFRVSGNRVLADMNLVSSHPAFSQIAELIKNIPSQIGLSISFAGSRVSSAGRSLLRVAELYSVDLVSQPAANPAGLFTAALRVGAGHNLTGLALAIHAHNLEYKKGLHQP